MERFREYKLWIYAGTAPTDYHPLELVVNYGKATDCHGSTGFGFAQQTVLWASH